MDANRLYNKITEILILTQFEAWIEKEKSQPTAEWLNSRNKRAIDYYLGKSKDEKLHILPSYDMTKFHHIVCLQASLIMREIRNL